MSAPCHKQTSPSLFDHLVGSGEQRLWDADTERLGSFQIEHKLVFGRQLQHCGVRSVKELNPSFVRRAT